LNTPIDPTFPEPLFDFAIKRSFSDLQVAIHKAINSSRISHTYKTEVDYCLGNYLCWMMAKLERLEEDKVSIDIDNLNYLRAFRYAFNELKHGSLLTRLSSQSGGFTFPLSFPKSIAPINYVWLPIAPSDTAFENQYKRYKKFLEAKTVLSTVQKATDILLEL